MHRFVSALVNVPTGLVNLLNIKTWIFLLNSLNFVVVIFVPAQSNGAVAILVSINIRDNGGEFRIEISGSLAGSVVEDVLFAWSEALRENASRRIVVDITHLLDYDFEGRALLQDMHRYGTQIAAASTQSLVFLNEISGPARLGLALVRKSPQKESPAEKPKEAAAVTPIRFARASGLD